MNLHAIIDEISKLETPSAHKAALDIFNLLGNNRRLFLEKLDADDFNGLLSGFESLAFASPADYTTSAYQSDFERLRGSLLYHLNKIL